MQTPTKICCLLFAFLVYSTLASAHLDIVSPGALAGLFDNDAIPFALSRYSKVPYGAHFVGALAAANPIDACSIVGNFTAGKLEIQTGVIAIVQKGGCQERVKILNAQLAGAKMVILVHDSDELPDNAGNIKSFEDVQIPTIIISKTNGNKMVEFIAKLPFPPLNPDDMLPIVTVSFPFETKSDEVAIDLWFSTCDSTNATYKFIKEFAPYVAGSEGAFQFTPHFVTWDCLLCKKLNYEIPISNDCLSGGRYCAPSPDTNGILPGSLTVHEDLRQICLRNTDLNSWWAYVNKFGTECVNVNNLEECSQIVLKSVATSNIVQSVDDCVRNNYIKSETRTEIDPMMDDNKILAAERELQLQYDITEFPVLLINHKPFYGDLNEVQKVLTSACNQLKHPRGQCQDKTVTLEGNESSGISSFLVVELLVVLTIMSVVLFYCYRRITKRKLASELSFEANNIVSRYMAMQDTSSSAEKQSDDENVQ